MKKPPESMKYILTTLIVCSTMVCSAQYHAFPQSDAIWEGSFIGFVGYPLKQYYVLCGDTMINNESFNKLYSIQLDTLGNVTSQLYMSGIREDENKRVWSQFEDETILLYDFNLEPGDTFPAAYYYSPDNIHEIVVDSIGETEVGGEMRRTIFFEDEYPFRREFWIEGIGSNYNILDRGLYLPGTADYEPYLECFRENNELLINLFPGESVCTFEYEAGPDCAISTNNENLIKPSISFEIYPNPARHYINLNIAGIPENPMDLKLIDILGNSVLQISPIVANQGNIALGDLSPGMYFLQLTDPAEQSKIAIKKLFIQR